jgi:hypothetical protein
MQTVIGMMSGTQWTVDAALLVTDGVSIEERGRRRSGLETGGSCCARPGEAKA